MKSKADEMFAFLDVETTGLDPTEHLLLEVGIAVTDLDFNILDMRSRVIRHSAQDLSARPVTDFVKKMHDENNLLNEVQSVTASDRMSVVQGDLMMFMRDWFSGETPPMFGSSLAMDRQFLRTNMTALDEMFHYRSIDNSSTKELCRRLNPDLYAKLPKFETDHRVRNCLAGTIAEAKFYADNFLFQDWY